jgi:hypothetical protein
VTRVCCNVRGGTNQIKSNRHAVISRIRRRCYYETKGSFFTSAAFSSRVSPPTLARSLVAATSSRRLLLLPTFVRRSLVTYYYFNKYYNDYTTEVGRLTRLVSKLLRWERKLRKWILVCVCAVKLNTKDLLRVIEGQTCI